MAVSSPAAATSPRRAGRHRYVPPQHGAWAFLALPLVLAASVAPPTWVGLVLAVTWIAAYPLSYFALSLARAKRPQRFRRPFSVWLAVFLPGAVVLLVARPWLAWVGLAYLLLFGISLRYARLNAERSLGNSLVFVVQCAAMVVVAWAVAMDSGGWRLGARFTGFHVPADVWVLTAICALVLAGSNLHVKSLIRERRDARYARWSRAVALASLALSVGLAVVWGLPGGLALVPGFVALALRAFLVGRRPVRAGVIGMVELACFVVVAAGAFLA